MIVYTVNQIIARHARRRHGADIQIDLQSCTFSSSPSDYTEQSSQLCSTYACTYSQVVDFAMVNKMLSTKLLDSYTTMIPDSHHSITHIRADYSLSA